jgi:Flp pilus assembly protein TadG
MLMPAAVLVLVVLGAMCVDGAVLFLGEREVANGADAAAETVAARLVDEDWYRSTGDVRLVCDTDRVLEEATASFTARAPDWLDDADLEVVDCRGATVTIRATATVGLVFAKALPGARERGAVSATGSAVARVR